MIFKEIQELKEPVTLYPRNLRTRSQIPVVGVTGRAPGWPGALKLPGAAV